jgi:glutamine amidotransferase
MIKIVDLQVGNIGSVVKAIRHLGADYELITRPEQLVGASKIILPGVGSYKAASDRMYSSGFIDALNEHVLQLQVPILGICVGMQLLATSGVEGGGASGLGYINATVNKIDCINGSLNIPHMGWNDVNSLNLTLFEDIPDGSCFYFVHSYAMTIENVENLDIAYTNYGSDVVAYVRKDNIHGAQFHPEKSQSVGLQFLRNFIEKC